MIVRIAPELRARLDQVQQHLRMSRSEFARRAMSAASDVLLEGECAEIYAPQR
jgi:predicted transcriptional regulator